MAFCSPVDVEPTSDDLAELAALGDRDAFGRLYQKWSDRVYRWVLTKAGGAHHPTEDICSEVWLKVGRSIRNFTRPADGAQGFQAWLRSLVNSCVTDYFRKATRQVETPTAELLAEPEALWVRESHDMDTPLSGELAAAIEGMSPLRRQVVTLRYFVGLTVAETADALGTTESAVTTNQCRALKDLRKKIGPIIAAAVPGQLHEAPLKTREAESMRGVSQ